MYYNYNQAKEIKEATVIWSTELIAAKIYYEMNRPGYAGPATFEDYYKQCLFGITAHPKKSSTGSHVFNAQLRMETQFSDFYAQDLRLRCTKNLICSKRTKFLQPLVIACFDIEGTRGGSAGDFTSMPHFHGVILFHHDTVSDYFKRNAVKELEDGGFQIIPPSGLIKSLYLKNIPTEGDLKRYLDYSLKYRGALTDNQSSYCPHRIYPETSKHYPFWEYLANMEDAGLDWI